VAPAWPAKGLLLLACAVQAHRDTLSDQIPLQFGNGGKHGQLIRSRLPGAVLNRSVNSTTILRLTSDGVIMPRTYSTIEKIRAELGWVIERPMQQHFSISSNNRP
jgi:hypothetical protein